MNTLNRKLALLATVLLFSTWIFMTTPTVKASPDVTGQTFKSLNYDGEINNYDEDYNAIRTATSGREVYSEKSTMIIGQGDEDVWNIWVYRGFVFFDTSRIPDSATILEAKLWLFIYDVYLEPSFNVTIQNGQPTYPHAPLVLTDYNLAFYSGNGGTKNLTGMDYGEWLDIPLNSNGLSWISKNGITKFCLRSNRDIEGIAPTGLERVTVYTSEKSAYYTPKLILNYSGYQAIADSFYVWNNDTAISNANWDGSNWVLSFTTQGDISISIGDPAFQFVPKRVMVGTEIWNDWTYHSDDHEVVINNVASQVEVYWRLPDNQGGDGKRGGDETDKIPSEDFVETVVAPTFFAIADNWIAFFILAGLMIGAVVSYIKDSEVWKYLLVAFIILTVNFFAVYVLVPQFSFLKPFLWKPPSLQLATYPLVAQQLLQIGVLSTLTVCFIVCIVLVMTHER